MSRRLSKTRFQNLIGAIKDKASLSKATIFSCSSDPQAVSIIKSTSHVHSAPPPDKHISAILSSSSRSSRAVAASTIRSIMSRLHHTRDAAVALKCLIVVHLVVKRGPFILQDQLSVCTRSGGRSYLNMSGFKDDRTHTKWVLSAFVRWHAGYVEQLLSTSRELGFFVGAVSNSDFKDKEEDRVSSSSIADLLREVQSMTDLVEEMYKAPDYLHGDEARALISEVVGLVGSDYLSLVNDLSPRLTELTSRDDSVSQFGNSAEILRVLNRLERCEEKLTAIFGYHKVSVQIFWDMINTMKGKFGHEGGMEGRMLTRSSESARFGDRVAKHDDSVRFASSRFNICKGMDC